MNGEAEMSRSFESSSSSLPPSAFSQTFSERTSASSQPSFATRQSSHREHDMDKTGRSAYSGPSVGLMTPPTPDDRATYGTYSGAGYAEGGVQAQGQMYLGHGHVGKDSVGGGGAMWDGPEGTSVDMRSSGSHGSTSGSISTSRPGSGARKISSGLSRHSPPPPVGPPPSAPPPLPPASARPVHPFAQPRAGYGAISRKPPPTAPLPSLPQNVLPPRSISASLPGPAYPPPSSALPPLPAQAGPSRTVSASATSFGSVGAGSSNLFRPGQSQSQILQPQQPQFHSSDHSRHSSVSSIRSAIGIPARSSSLTPPTSPTKTAGGFNISPRNSSLYTIPQNGTPLDPPFQLHPSAPPSHTSTSRQSSRLVSTSDSTGRTSSKLLLQSALALAQQAVEMDRQNNVTGALEAYKEAVRRLKDVIERVGAPGDRDKRTSGGRSEDEGRTLKGIHDAYIARIELLSSFDAPNDSSTHMLNGDDAMRSTVTLVPQASQTDSPENVLGDIPAGERTPRLSLGNHAGDTSGIADIGNLMLSDPDESISSLGPRSLGMAGAALEDSPTTPMPAQRNQEAGQGNVREPGHARSASQSLQDMLEARPSTLNGSAVAVDEMSLPSKDKDLPVAPAIQRDVSSHSRHASSDSLLDPTGFGGPTISQRRQMRNNDGTMSAIPELDVLTSASPIGSGRPFPPGFMAGGHPPNSAPGVYGQPMTARSVSAAIAPSTVSDPSEGQRLRAQSQPGGTAPPVFRASLDAGPMPPVASLHLGIRSNHLAPPSANSAHFSLSSSRSIPPPHILSASTGSLLSPLPEAQPAAFVRRPFHLLRILLQSMDPASPGAYLTGTVHISSPVWKPSQWAKTGSTPNPRQALGPPKIQAQDVKARVIEALVLQYEAIRQAGAPLLHGERQWAYGMAPGGPPTPSKNSRTPGVERQRAEQMCALLEEGEGEMEAGWKMLSKAGVSVAGWKGKKGGAGGKWGARISKMTDKMTNTKASESPDRYVDLLSNLCAGAQVIDNHLSCYTGPCPSAYHLLPEPLYRTLEARLVRQADFVAAVVVPFVLDDFRQFFLRYLKGGIRYLED